MRPLALLLTACLAACSSSGELDFAEVDLGTSAPSTSTSAGSSSSGATTGSTTTATTSTGTTGGDAEAGQGGSGGTSGVGQGGSGGDDVCEPATCAPGDCETIDDGCGGNVDCDVCDGVWLTCSPASKCECWPLPKTGPYVAAHQACADNEVAVFCDQVSEDEPAGCHPSGVAVYGTDAWCCPG